jgi:hypothetical protein
VGEDPQPAGLLVSDRHLAIALRAHGDPATVGAAMNIHD